MSFNLLFFIFITIYCSPEKEEGFNIKEKIKFNNLPKNNGTDNYYKDKTKRQLEDFQPIRICLETQKLQSDLEEAEENLLIINNALKEAKETLEKIINVTRMNKIVIPNDIKNKIIDKDKYKGTGEFLDNGYEYDLIIFVKARGLTEDGWSDNTFAKPNIYYKSPSDGRPIIGSFKINYDYLNVVPSRVPNNNEEKAQALKILFMHEMTHILGFEKTIFQNKKLLSNKNSKRTNNQGISKTIFTGANVIARAIKYFNCNSIKGLELATNSVEGDNFPHWEGRLLLGDYMTSDLIYSDQLISEFTLALLEDLGWYKVNYYTGGLMKFGKNKGCDFIDKDCVNIGGEKITSRFPNDFCSETTYGTCSAGRQSRGYCYTESTINDARGAGLERTGWESHYGIDIAEYCPATKDTLIKARNVSYIGNCKIGNDKYGDQIISSYEDYSEIFAESFGTNSFCALSSIIQQKSSVGGYQGQVRPTCYPMICSDQSLTIQLKDEYIVCPRKGGMIKIENKGYTKYVGYLFCPDYNLICTGTIMCNNLFDCINQESQPKEYSYEYAISDTVTSEVTEDIKTEDKLSGLVANDENYELSENNATCPINCRQCLSNKRCILCRNFTNTEPHAYYIGIKENSETDSIICSETKPSKGYYNKSINTHIHYFTCTDGCDQCQNADQCDSCAPTHKITQTKKCEERIPNCKKYNESTIKQDQGGYGYQECENCDNERGYYCFNMNKKYCNNSDDFTKEIYYKMEDREYSCIGLCGLKYSYCIKCDKNECFKCDLEHYVNRINVTCDERIPKCKKYDESSKITDSDGNPGYSKCSECYQNHYCLADNKSICQYISPADLEHYYYDYGNGCKDLCENKYPYCERCDGTKCLECLTKMKSDGTCVTGFPHCKKYDKEHANETYVECLECDNANGYYCINMNKTSCDKIDLDIIHYYKLETKTFPCVRKCQDEYQECSTCNNTHCIECKPRHILSLDEKKCLFKYDPEPNDVCKVLAHTIDKNIEDLNLDDFIDFYFENTFAYLKTVDHFVNENYTVTMFINSECTEDLLKLGYFKIDSKDLYNSMVRETRTETNEFLISIFVVYNNQNHFRFYNIYSTFLDPNKRCHSCLDVPFMITNNYNNKVNIMLGPLFTNLLASEDIDIFSKDSQVYTNPCVNVTLKGIDIPIKERYKYIYLKKQAIKIACSGDNCEIDKVNNKESSCTCKCKIGNQFEDILDINTDDDDTPDNQDTMEEFPAPSKSISLKCMKNGFKAKNIKANGGFYISLIAVIGQGGLCVLYFLFSKVIIIPKNANPPSKIKNRLKLISTWGQENNKKMRKNEVMCDFQPRDDGEDDLFQEEESYINNPDLIFSYSFDSKIGDEKNKDGKKVLVLLKKKKSLEGLTESEQEYLTLYKEKNKTFCGIYWSVITIKQHIINWFSSMVCCKVTESYIPLPIKIIRSILMVILSFFINSLFLTQEYFAQKFKYFNSKYKLLVGSNDELTITLEEIDGNTVIPTNDKSSYAFSHTIVNAIIVFAILLVVQLLLGVIFFYLRVDVEEISKKNDPTEINEFESKVRIKYIIFFAVNFVLMVILLFVFIGFGGIYGGGFLDYFVPGIISLILLEIFPFLWSLIITLIIYLGVKFKIKCCLKIRKYLIF